VKREFPFGISGLDVIAVPEFKAEARIKRDAAVPIPRFLKAGSVARCSI